MKLHVLIQKDAAGYFVAEVPALPGYLSMMNSARVFLPN
jgi:predicted RNase H-like HicB family nuclease